MVYPPHITHKECDNIARLSTCKNCNIKLNTEEKYSYSSKTYCKDCYDIQIQKKESYNNLISDICKYFHIDQPTGLILKQIKQYKEDLSYSYDGIRYVLWYIKEILHKEFILKYGIALVKFNYENAEEYYKQQEEIKKSTEYSDIENEIKIVKFNYQKSKQVQCLINIDDLIKGGGDN